MGAFSIWHWLVVLAIVVLLFGPGRIGSLGKDLGKGIKDFKDAMNEKDVTPTKIDEKTAQASATTNEAKKEKV